MAWLSSGNSNASLISQMARHGLISSGRVKNAMSAIDRAHFAPWAPYEDSPQSIGYNATISAPHMHAAACESLEPFLQPGARVLDIGSGSGYLTAVLAELVCTDSTSNSSPRMHPDGEKQLNMTTLKNKPEGTAQNGCVVGVDHIQGLVDLATKNLRKSDYGTRLLDRGIIKFVKADGRLGYNNDKSGGDTTSDISSSATSPLDSNSEEQWDAIHVGAAAKEAHEPLIRQLKRPGRLFIPVGKDTQYIYVIDKLADGRIERQRQMAVRYVPLTDAPKIDSS